MTTSPLSRAYAVGQSTLLCLFALGYFVAPGRRLTESHVAGSGGSMLCAAGLGLLTAALVAMRGVIQIAPAPRADGHLVTHGVYGLLRHPIYTAILLLVAGLFLRKPTLPILLGATAIGVFLACKARFEERLLAARYPAYVDYARRTWGLLPTRRLARLGVPDAPRPAQTGRARVDSIDLLRGCVMILMALDHVRDYFGNAAVDPTDPATTTAALFFTRWITHFCAPVFFLLTGVGSYLAGRRRTTSGLSRFLLTRGLWFLVLELFVMRCFGWQFNFDYRVTLLTVLWAIGWGLIVLAGLVYLPANAVAAIGVVMIAVHNLFDRVPAAAFGRAAPLWSILHAPGVVYSDGRHLVFAAYTLIPWIGVIAAGYGMGRIFEWEPARRRRVLVLLGSALTMTFLVLRAVNVYGDPRPWRHFPSGAHTALSFLNATKYPPSLLFLLMTLGPALLFLRVVDGRTPKVLRPALVFGRVPLFYYMLHVVVMHLLAVGVCQWRYGTVHWMFESPGLAQFPVTQPPGWPVALPSVYWCWMAVVVILYPLCVWFAGVRRRRSDWWLRYL